MQKAEIRVLREGGWALCAQGEAVFGEFDVDLVAGAAGECDEELESVLGWDGPVVWGVRGVGEIGFALNGGFGVEVGLHRVRLGSGGGVARGFS